MIIFQESRPATLEDVRWLRETLARRLDESRLRTLDPKLYDKSIRLSLIDSVVIAVAELANNIVLHAKPKASTITLTVRLAGAALRVELADDGGSFTEFSKRYTKAKKIKQPAFDQVSGRGLWLVSRNLQDLEYQPGSPNRLVAWRRLRRACPHVLVITGDPNIQALVRAGLNGGYRIYAADDPHQALALSKQQKIDVIIADHAKVSAAPSVLKNAFHESPIPIIMIASGDEIAKINGQAALYVDHVLEAGFTGATLIGTVEIAIASYTKRLIHIANYFGQSAGLLLSDALPAELPGYRVAGLSATASFGGGDFALALTGNGFSRLVLADIMGHGLRAKAAAIALASMVRTLHCREQGSPATLLKAVSAIIAEEPAFSDLIATLIVVDLTPGGWISAASAGHPQMAVISGERCLLLPPIGPLPGLVHAPHYELASHRLNPGDKLAIITDGIDSETMATAAFPESLLAVLQKAGELELDCVKVRAREWIEARLGPAPKDDWTLILAEYRPQPAAQAGDRLQACAQPLSLQSIE